MKKNAVAAIDPDPPAESPRPWIDWVNGQPEIADGRVTHLVYTASVSGFPPGRVAEGKRVDFGPGMPYYLVGKQPFRLPGDTCLPAFSRERNLLDPQSERRAIVSPGCYERSGGVGCPGNLTDIWKTIGYWRVSWIRSMSRRFRI